MRVLFMTEAWYPTVGGIVLAVDNVAQALKAEGHHVSVVADRIFPETPKEEVIHGITVRRVWYLMPTTAISLEPRTFLRFFAYLLASPFVFPANMLRLIRIVQRERPDIVNVHYLGRNAFYALMLRPFFQFKLVLNICGYDLDRYPEASRIVKLYIKTVLRWADLVLANTNFQLRAADAICPGVSRKSGTIGPGIHPQEFDGLAPYRHPRPYLLTISNLHYRKGLDLAARALALVRQQRPDLDLIMVGEGEERSRLETLAHELGIAGNVVFFGVADRVQVGELLKGCELLVLPSRTESFAVVLVEAMQVGKTSVAARVGGVPEVLRDGERGLLVEPESPESLAEGILQLLGDPALRARLVDGFAEKVREEYPWFSIAKRYLGWYERARAEAE